MAPRTLERLNDRRVRTAKPKGKTKRVLLCDGGNLYLQISLGKDHNVRRSWVFRYKRSETEPVRDMGLGSLNTIGLAKAREIARMNRELLIEGKDPITERDASKAALVAEQAKVKTFGECARAYIEANQSSWKNLKHANQWRMTVLGVLSNGKPAENDYCKSIRDLPVNMIDTPLVLKVLQAIWSTKTETASRLRSRIEIVLDYAKVGGFRTGENPARWKGHLQHSLAMKSRIAPGKNHPALPYTQLPEFMAALRQREGVAARALEFSILTAARTGETIGAARSEIKDGLWTIPKARMKGTKGGRKSDHTVPLSRQAIAILKHSPRQGDHLFAGDVDGEPLSDNAMWAVIGRMNDDREKAGLPKWTDPHQGNREIVPHGFRSTFKDWCTELTNYPGEMSEVALSHAVSGKTEAAYRRGAMVEKRRRMMADWATFCDGKTVGGDNVVAIGARK